MAFWAPARNDSHGFRCVSRAMNTFGTYHLAALVAVAVVTPCSRRTGLNTVRSSNRRSVAREASLPARVLASRSEEVVPFVVE